MSGLRRQVPASTQALGMATGPAYYPAHAVPRAAVAYGQYPPAPARPLSKGVSHQGSPQDVRSQAQNNPVGGYAAVRAAYQQQRHDGQYYAPPYPPTPYAPMPGYAPYPAQEPHYSHGMARAGHGPAVSGGPHTGVMRKAELQHHQDEGYGPSAVHSLWGKASPKPESYQGRSLVRHDSGWSRASVGEDPEGPAEVPAAYNRKYGRSDSTSSASADPATPTDRRSSSSSPSASSMGSTGRDTALAAAGTPPDVNAPFMNTTSGQEIAFVATAMNWHRAPVVPKPVKAGPDAQELGLAASGLSPAGHGARLPLDLAMADLAGGMFDMSKLMEAAAVLGGFNNIKGGMAAF